MRQYTLLYFIAVLFFFPYDAFSQMSGGFNGSKRLEMVNLDQMIGLAPSVLGKDPYANVEGTPFLYDFFSDCSIQFNDDKWFAGPKVRFNATTQKFHYLNSKNEELVPKDGLIKRFAFTVPDKKDSITYVFSCGYPDIGINTSSTYYQEYNTGTATVLRFISKSVVERKTLATVNPVKQFSETSVYYVFNSAQNKIEKWRKGKDFIIDFLSDKSVLVTKFINDNKLSCKSVEDVILVIQYYNNLKVK
jgi:hypothetical protein